MTTFKEKRHENTFLLPLEQDTNANVLLILNSDCHDSSLLKILWNNCNRKLCCDGGANQLYNTFSIEEESIRNYHVPDIIIGDLDSLQQQTRLFYEDRGSRIVLDPDQETNDLEKALNYVQYSLGYSDVTNLNVIIYGNFSGRFDHAMANVHALLKWKSIFHRIVVVDRLNTTEVLEENVVHVMVPIANELIVEGVSCGLLPLGNKVDSVTTSGLVWNLDDESLELGKRISSSNSIDTQLKLVRVRVSEPIIWTCSIKSSIFS